MNTRTDIEAREAAILSPYACRASESRGRVRPEEKDFLRTDFQRDRDRIVHSKSFRRLMHKTQVFLSPEGDHYRTRLTHTLEVAQIARTIARGLALNEDLTEAVALGHDLGHTPFGHNGEYFLNQVHPGGFRHTEQSLRVVDVLEDAYGRRGLNLTWEVRNGIRYHSGKIRPETLEGQVVHLADRIAYINHDIDDAIRGGVISQSDLPDSCTEYLGETHSRRITTLVTDIIRESDGKGVIIQSRRAAEEMNTLRSFMFENVYASEKVKSAQDMDHVKRVVTGLYMYFRDHPEEMPADLYALTDEYGPAEMAKDHVAGMTDRFAENLYREIFGKNF